MRKIPLLDNRIYDWHYDFVYPPAFGRRYNQAANAANKLFVKYPFADTAGKGYVPERRKLKKIKRWQEKERRKSEVWLTGVKPPY